MGGRKVPMKVGDLVEERKHPHRRCKILRVGEKDDNGKPKTFVVSFVDGDTTEKEVIIEVGKVQRVTNVKKNSKGVDNGLEQGKNMKVAGDGHRSVKGNTSGAIGGNTGRAEGGNTGGAMREGVGWPVGGLVSRTLSDGSARGSLGTAFALAGPRHVVAPVADWASKAAPSEDVELAAGEHLKTKSCVWLREHEEKDPNFQVLDLQIVMCKPCEAGGEAEYCNREKEAVEMFKTQLARSKEQIDEVPPLESDDSSEDLESRSCLWLRANGKKDPRYNIDLCLVMCKSCKRDDTENCSRVDDAPLLVIETMNANTRKKRTAQKPPRLSYSPNQVRATGVRLAKDQNQDKNKKQQRSKRRGTDLNETVARAGG